MAQKDRTKETPIQHTSSTHNDSSDAVTKLTEELNSKNQQIKSLQSEIDNLKNDINNRNKSYATLESNNECIILNNQRLNEQLDKANGLNLKLSNQISALKAANQKSNSPKLPK